MPRVYELPTHLQVEDVLIAGLTARQLVRLMVGASVAYGLWDQTATLPILVRLSATGVLVVAGLLLALIRPAGRPLDQWLIAALLFAAAPRRQLWRRSTPDFLYLPPSEAQGWAELAPRPDWISDVDSTDGNVSPSMSIAAWRQR
ncbi:MAG TPA: PrgI family protein [Chloroflexota bacterium]|nr:PrgI family protein [Chloroflexota bacterium]